MADSGTIYRGQWWLPSEPNNTQAGTLRVEPSGTCTLELVGGFELSNVTATVELVPGITEDKTEDATYQPVILGQSGSEQFSLLYCNLRSATGGLPFMPVSNHILNVGRVLEGIHMETPDDEVFYGAAVAIDYLLLWSGISVLQSKLTFPGNADGVVSTASQLVGKEREAQHDGLTWIIGVAGVPFNSSLETPDRHVLTAYEHAYVRIEGTTPHVREFWDAEVRKIQNLVTISMNHPCAIRSQRYGLFGPDGQVDHRVNVYGRRSPRPEAQPAKNIRFGTIFTLRNFEWSTLLPAWLQLAQDTDVAVAALAGLHYQTNDTQTRLLTVCTAIESLHRALYNSKPYSTEGFKKLRAQVLAGIENEVDKAWVSNRFRNDLGYVERAKVLASKADPKAVESLLGDIGKWAQLAREARNGLAHATGSAAEITPEMQLRLLYVTRILIALVLASELGMTPEDQQGFVDLGSRTTWEAEQFKKLLLQPKGS